MNNAISSKDGENKEKTTWTQWGMEQSISHLKRAKTQLDEATKGLQNKAFQAMSFSIIFIGLFFNAISMTKTSLDTLSNKWFLYFLCGLTSFFFFWILVSFWFSILAIRPRTYLISGPTDELIDSIRYESDNEIADQILTEIQDEFNKNEAQNKCISKQVFISWIALGISMIPASIIIMLLVLI